MSILSRYEPVIGLEVHAQLSTRTKLFSGCELGFGAEPNAATCPVSLGLPGALPVLNRAAVAMAVKAALATHCTVHEHSRFARKHYFYPDLPKGYQISQYESPYATGGYLDVPTEGGEQKRIHLTRIHMEEDAGKSIHEGGGTLVDFNRSGVPLCEIVSEPELRSAQDAADYLRALRSLLRYLEVCSGDMEKGEFRCDANISIRPRGQERFGTRVEIKNLNSYRHVHKAIEYEIVRQAELLDAGGTVVQETRLWNPDKNVTASMRGKEDAHDYRYFPDPDLPPLIIPPAWVDELRAQLPELPAERRERYVRELGLSAYDAAVLTGERVIAEYFEALVAGGSSAKLAANWIAGEVLRVMNRDNLDAPPLAVDRLAGLLTAVENGAISGSAAKKVFEKMLTGEGSAPELIRALGLEQVSDEGALRQAVDQVLADNAASVASYRAGQVKLLGFFVGKVMKLTGGKANPQLVNALVKEKLG